MNTTENNSKIAVFLGLIPNATYKYHKDWNELIFLVQEITVTTEFHTDYPKNSKFWDVYTQLDKQEVYNACLEFINWYNENKK